MKKIDRRAFLKNSFTLIAGTGLIAAGKISDQTYSITGDKQIMAMPKRPLGKTGFDVSLFSLGGLATVNNAARKDDAIAIINRALDLGVNFIDTASRYGDGISETHIGMVMKERRKEVFLATKSHDFTYDGTMRLFEESLKRLQTDYIDLYQHHYVNTTEHLGQITARNSARYAFEKLKEEGAIGHIGITGHSSKVLADAIENYPYETALITLNPSGSSMDDPQHMDRFFRFVNERNVGVISMKVFGGGGLMQQGFTPKDLLSYVYSYPVSTAVVGISEMAHLEQNVDITKNFDPLTEEEMSDLRRRTQI